MTILSFSLPSKTFWEKSKTLNLLFPPFLMPIQFLSQSSWFEAKKQFLNLLLPPLQHSYFGLPCSFSFYFFFLGTSFICGFLLLALRSWCFPNVPILCYLLILFTFLVTKPTFLFSFYLVLGYIQVGNSKFQIPVSHSQSISSLT